MSDTNPPQGQAADAGATTPESGDAYRVLARKYRPATFGDLIGQDTLVRTLTNAIEAGRVPQAFMLTGVRGVGKTTTARIIARALNCIGPDGNGGPTVNPCGVCDHCRSIGEDRHVDVIEMDAASRSGVGEIRDLIDGVRYRPVSARRKVYVVDEVHMLSTQAFNALLKTLEEPPEHATFVFATTEIRKVPVTVLSRCMRFDLRRVEQATLSAHFRSIVDRESVAAPDEALSMIARAADGSVRDGLSMLDQAIALSGGEISADLVKQMLGLADRARIYDLYDAVLGGRSAEALDFLGDLYNAGADPAVVLQDLLEVTHTLTRLQVVGEAAATAGLPETERTRGRGMAKALRPAVLARNWQMLLKGLQEVQQAPQPRQAAEMVLLRLIHAAELPPPAEIIRQLRGEAGTQATAAGSSPPNGSGQPSAGGDVPSASGHGPGTGAGNHGTGGGGVSGGAAPPATGEGGSTAVQSATPASAPESAPRPSAASNPDPRSLREVVALCQERREPKLAADIKQSVHQVRFEPGRIELRLGRAAPKDLAGKLGECLSRWTGRRWVVSVSGEHGEPTLDEQDARHEEAERQRLLSHPKVRALLDIFPDARLVGHRGGPEPAPPIDAETSDDTTPMPDETILGDPDAFEGDDEL